MNSDPLAPLLDLPGVQGAADKARDILSKAHRHPANRREWARSATEASLRGARASASLAGAAVELSRDADVIDPALAGALRVSQMLDGSAVDATVAAWRRAPMQVLARLHTLAAADLVDDADQLGRPRADGEVGDRLNILTQIVTGATAVPAPVVAAVVHGELLALRPFVCANGVVARAASRLVCVASGLDPHNLGVPEVGMLKKGAAYMNALDGFAAGTAVGVGGWVMLCCAALEVGGHEAVAIADGFAS